MAWCNPPPPGTEFGGAEEDLDAPQRGGDDRVIDRIDPFLKSSEYLRYERKMSSERRRRSRSRSRHRRRRRSRSRSRHRHKRRRGAGAGSSSRSHSRSPRSSPSSRHHRRRRRSTSRSQSRSRRRGGGGGGERRPHGAHGGRSRSHGRRTGAEAVGMELERQPPRTAEEPDDDEEDEEVANENAFKNDGTFMEMFKKMQEEIKAKTEAEKAEQQGAPPLPASFGKRRGGKVLKTGLVQKSKAPGQEEGPDTKDAWSLYMKEVKRYKEACCDDDSKTRLLVK